MLDTDCELRGGNRQLVKLTGKRDYNLLKIILRKELIFGILYCSVTNPDLIFLRVMNIFQCGNSQKQLNPKNVQDTVKHGGGGVMIWGCMSKWGR